MIFWLTSICSTLPGCGGDESDSPTTRCLPSSEHKKRKGKGWWGEGNAKETILENLCLFVIRVRNEPDSLLHNFSDYRNLEAGVVVICMRNRTHRITFICEYLVSGYTRERSFTVLLCFMGKIDVSLYLLEDMNHDTCNQNKQTVGLLSHKVNHFANTIYHSV